MNINFWFQNKQLNYLLIFCRVVFELGNTTVEAALEIFSYWVLSWLFGFIETNVDENKLLGTDELWWSWFMFKLFTSEFKNSSFTLAKFEKLLLFGFRDAFMLDVLLSFWFLSELCPFCCCTCICCCWAWIRLVICFCCEACSIWDCILVVLLLFLFRSLVAFSIRSYWFFVLYKAYGVRTLAAAAAAAVAVVGLFWPIAFVFMYLLSFICLSTYLGM